MELAMMMRVLDEVEMAKQFYQNLYMQTRDISYLWLSQDFYHAFADMRNNYE